MPFDDRRAALIDARNDGAARRPVFISGAELAREREAVTSSYNRLVAIPPTAWTPAAFDAATSAFLHETGFDVLVSWNATTLPPLGPDVFFRYSGNNSGVYFEAAERAADGETIIVVAVREGERVIGYGVATSDNKPSSIEIIDVDESSRRSVGLASSIVVDGQQFTIGVGHIIVKALVPELQRPILADATHDSSRYVFRSLGFARRAGEKNPCLLYLE